MGALRLDVNCTAGGTTMVTLSFESRRSGGTNDNISFRIARRGGGQPDLALPGEPNFVMTADKDVRTWIWLDVGVPTDGTYNYNLQIKRNDGNGTINAMNFMAVHYAK